MDKKVVRASYESCLNAIARLNAYATSKPFSGATEINKRQDVLATDDLISFCIHARRLIENAGLKDLLNQTFIKHTNGTPFSLWRIIGYLIHHDALEILRCDTRMQYLADRENGKTHKEALEKIVAEKQQPYSEPIPPRIVFKSDKIEQTIMNLETFLRIFSQDILPEVIQKARDEGLDLRDNPLKDVDMTEEFLEVLSRSDTM